ncbi:response regulator [Methanoplanus sp. FWC-SCC4]|uniref:Response regulator n=1 Tax=Methanochimaera problematica TaxID=2609417 RepID=A0AA97FF34_9EURY|nr:response regulator [Methanoplanus sp. FWC-SCC4]WOF17118.1 response regulator [Methanoplanus sp. FWC-SCC4]
MAGILIVDDTKVLANLYCNFLTHSGYECDAVYGGDECFYKINDLNPDIILLDTCMEPCDSWEILAKIKKNPKTAGISVLMMESETCTREKIIEKGFLADGYIQKPVKSGTLENIIKSAYMQRSRVLRIVEDAFDEHESEEERKILFNLCLNAFALNSFKKLVAEAYEYPFPIRS